MYRGPLADLRRAWARVHSPDVFTSTDERRARPGDSVADHLLILHDAVSGASKPLTGRFPAAIRASGTRICFRVNQSAARFTIAKAEKRTANPWMGISGTFSTSSPMVVQSAHLQPAGSPRVSFRTELKQTTPQATSVPSQ